MKPVLIGILSAVLAVQMLAAGAQRAEDAERLLKAAMNTELVDGDLKAAIEQYKKVVQSGNRALAAQALVHMAECYQKLGDAEARTIYERIVREFPDRKEEVALARARLGGTAAVASSKGDRPVWTGPKVDPFGRVSPDGRFITYVDWEGFINLTVHDVVADTDRALTSRKSYAEPFQAGYSVISPDGKQVAYVLDTWDNKGNSTLSVRITPLQATGFPPPRQLFAVSGEEVRFLSVFDWSPDGKSLAVLLNRKDGTSQIALVAVADGSLRVLKSVGWRGPERIFFSRDSKYIAYDLPAGDTIDQRDVFVLAVDGSREIPAVVHSASEAVMGWSPDGTRLLFSSDRTGSVGLWALPFADGKPQGAPELLRADIGASSVSLGLTTAGALYIYKTANSRDVRVAPIDLNAGKLLGPPANFPQGFLDAPRDPDWSPDGKYLAYQACGGSCVAIRSVDTGQVRQLPRTVLYSREPRWSPDGRSFVVAGRDFKGRDGIFRIDVQTGQATSVVQDTRLGAAPRWSSDGSKVYYISPNDRGLVLERDLNSGAGREVFRHPLLHEANLSPDGRYFAVRTTVNPSTQTSSLLLVPVGGGPPRELLRLSQQETLPQSHTISWLPDSKSVMVAKKPESRTELWLIPIGDGQPRKLDIDVADWTLGAPFDGTGYLDSGFSLSPDGRHIAFLMGKNASEVWALENVLPKQSAK